MNRVTSLPSEPPRFFRRGPSPLARLTVFGLLSVVLMFVDAQFRTLETVRRGIAMVVYPVQQAALWPGEALLAVRAFFESREALRRDNERLQNELLLANQEALAARAARAEAEQLKALALLGQQHNTRVKARVLYLSRDPFSQKIFIDRPPEPIEAGAAVVDERGLLGQVTRVHPLLAEVTLLTEKEFAVPVKVERTGLRAILYGRGPGKPPELRFVPSSADLREGDVLLTSGIDGVFPGNIKVATIGAPRRDRESVFLSVEASPSAGLWSSEYVLVLPRPPALPPRPALESDKDRPSKDARRRKG